MARIDTFKLIIDKFRFLRQKTDNLTINGTEAQPPFQWTISYSYKGVDFSWSGQNIHVVLQFAVDYVHYADMTVAERLANINQFVVVKFLGTVYEL